MFYPKVVAATTIQAFFLSIVIGYYDPPTPLLLTWAQKWLEERAGELVSLAGDAATTLKHRLAVTVGHRRSAPAVVFTPDQLSRFDGTRTAGGLYLAFLGRVYDVGVANKHYRPGGSYHAFAARDASRAFATGDLTEAGLTDHVLDLSKDQLKGIFEWAAFYDREYKSVGVLSGRYYDSKGKPTAYLNKLNEVRKTVRLEL